MSLPTLCGVLLLYGCACVCARVCARGTNVVCVSYSLLTPSSSLTLALTLEVYS